jgi:hypothetical protein
MVIQFRRIKKIIIQSPNQQEGSQNPPRPLPKAARAVRKRGGECVVFDVSRELL